MAKVWLEREGLASHVLPAVCMACGEPAEHRVPRTFSWIPGWTYLLILVHVLIFIIVALIIRQRQEVLVPVCARHRGYWARRMWFIGLSFAGVFGLAIAVGLFGDQVGIDEQDTGMIGFFVMVVGLVVWLIVTAVIQMNSIRAGEFRPKAIKLLGVSPVFAEAYEEELARADELLDRSVRERWGDRPEYPRRAPEVDSEKVRRRSPDERSGRDSPPDAIRE